MQPREAERVYRSGAGTAGMAVIRNPLDSLSQCHAVSSITTVSSVKNGRMLYACVANSKAYTLIHIDRDSIMSL